MFEKTKINEKEAVVGPFFKIRIQAKLIILDIRTSHYNSRVVIYVREPL